MTNRRQFLKYLLSTPLAATIDYEKLLWVPETRIVVPNLAELPALYGIPYHHDNFSMGTWLGIPRGEANKEIINLIKHMKDHQKYQQHNKDYQEHAQEIYRRQNYPLQYVRNVGVI